VSNLYVLSVGRNPNTFLNRCVYSVQNQLVQPDQHIVIDDVSDDETKKIIENLPKHENLQIIQNTERKYRLKNIWENSINKDPDDVICLVDSDDWLTDVGVLGYIKHAYDKSPELEYLYSKYILSHGEPGCSQSIPSNSWEPYNSPWITSHMCTYRAKALQRVPVSNFLDWNGEWFKIATDHAMILPMLHMLKEKDGGFSSVGFVKRPMYVHSFLGNPSKPRTGTPESEERSRLAVECSTYIKQRGFVES